MTAVRHLTIVGRRRADLALPATIPIVQLIPRLVQLVETDASGSVYLARPTGEPLVADRTLDQLGVVDGEMLLLHGEGEVVTPPVLDDWVGAVARATDVGRGRWTASMGRDLALAVAAAGVAAGGGLAAFAHLPVLAVALTIALLVVAAGLTRIPSIGWPAQVWAALALPLAALAIATIAPRTGTPFHVWTMGLRAAAIGVVALAAVFATPSLVAPFLGVALAALPVAAAALLVGSGYGTPAQAAVVLGIFWMLLLWRLPSLVVAVIGWRRPPSARGEMVGLEAVGRRVVWGRVLLTWLIIGTCVGLLISLIVLSRTPGKFPLLLMLALGLAVLLRARHHHFTGEVAPLVLLGLAALGLLEVRLLIQTPLLGIAVAVASAVGIAVMGWLAGLALRSVFVRRGLQYLELVANAALVPLAVGALGLYTLASQLGHHIG